MAAADRPILLDLSWVHDCWCIDCVNKSREGRMSLISPLAESKEYEKGLFEIHAGNLKLFLKNLKAQKGVKALQIVRVSGTRAWVHITFKKNSLVYERIAATNSIPLLPSMTEAGRDYLTVLVPNDKALRELKSTLRDDVDVKIVSKTYLDSRQDKTLAPIRASDLMRLDLTARNLSALQRDAFLLATKEGYFDTPRKVDIDGLASRLGMAPATFSEHLRKAQAKLFPPLARAIGEMDRRTRPV